MVVDRNNNNDMDNLPISIPVGYFIDIYIYMQMIITKKIDPIVTINNLIYGRFPIYFELLIRLKPNDIVFDDIPFLIASPFIYHPENDHNTPIFLAIYNI